MAAETASASVRIPLGFTSFSLIVFADLLNRLAKSLTHCPGAIQMVDLGLL
jgi:hypothetical protein